MLIVGVSQYQKFLPGPDKDVELMWDMAVKLGFKPAQIKIVQEKAATRKGILGAINNWLIKGTKAGDRAIFYFSGHGSQVPDTNGDEDDNCDEVIVPQDLQVITDDELDTAMQKIPATEILSIFDSCFSGTALRSMDSPVVGKLLPKSDGVNVQCGMPVNVRSLDAVDKNKNPNPKQLILGFSAAAQNEVALGRLAAKQGSAFTQGLYNAVMAAKTSISFLDLRDKSSDYIRKNLPSNAPIKAHTPQLDMPKNLETQNFFRFGKLNNPITPLPNNSAVDTAPNYNTMFDRLIRSSKFFVDATSVKSKYKLGEDITLRFISSKAGFVNIFEIGSSGKLNLLFPNQFNENNQIQPQEAITMPSLERFGDFRFFAQAPVGKSRVLALVTSTPLNLYQIGMGNAAGIFQTFDATQQIVRSLTGIVARDIGVTAANPASVVTPAAPTTAPATTTPPIPETPTVEHGAAEFTLEVVN